MKKLSVVLLSAVLVASVTMIAFAGGQGEAREPYDGIIGPDPGLPVELHWPVDELGPQPMFEELAGQRVNLTFTLFAGGHIEMLTQLADNFNRLYSHIDINFDIQQSPTGAHFDALAAQLVAGTGAPDIVAMEISRTGRFYTPPFNTQFRDISLPGHLAENLTQQVQYQDSDGRQVGVDLVGPEPAFMYYREDIMAEAGIEMPIETWDEYIEAGRILKDKLGYKLTGLGYRSRSDASQFVGMFVQAGNPLYDEDGEFVINDSNSLEVLERLVQLYEEDLVADLHRDDPVLHQRFLGQREDQVASFIMPTWVFMTRLGSDVETPNWRIQNPPAFDSSDRRAYAWGGTALSVVESQSKYPELAEAFLHYMLSVENQVQKFENFGWLPSIVSAMESDRVLSVTQPQFFGDQPIGEIYAEAVRNLPSYRFGPTWPEMNTEIAATFDMILTDGPQAWLEMLEDLEAEVRQD